MSTKGLRHHMVMNSHHHRWATRRTVSATTRLTKSHAATAAVQSGRRVKKKQLPKTPDGHNPAIPSPPSFDVQSRGSFDAFFAAQLGQTDSSPATAKSTPVTTQSTDNQFPKTSVPTIETNQYYAAHLLEQLAADTSNPGQKFKLSTSLQIDPSPSSLDLRPVHPYFADLGLPCGSVHNTISHLFAAEKLWQHRYQNEIPSASLTKLWDPHFESSGFQWSDYCSQELGLPKINIDVEASLGSESNTQYILSMNLEEQHDLAAMVLSKLSIHLDDQNTHWISLIQGTSEPDLFGELGYFSTDYTPSRLLSDPSWSPSTDFTVTRDDFTTDKTKLTTMPRLVALNHLFMHGTHHRSQVLTVASQFTGEQTVVDLSAFVPEWKQIHSKVFRWA